jgi:DNA polymerase III epsilon subunit family exonuclease
MSADTAVPISDGRTHLVTSWTDPKYVVVDVEGNGQQPPELVELAIVPIVGGVIGEPVNWMVRPDRPITPMARRIHGITNEQLVHTDTFADVRASVLEALQADVLVAHNAHVDVGVLQRQLGEWECPEVFDTLKLARRLLPGRPSYKLGALVNAFMLGDDLPEELVPHRAEYDALVTARLFVHLVTHTYAEPVSLDELRGGPPQGGGDDETATLF